MKALTKLLGVGRLTAVIIVAEIGEVARFPSIRMPRSCWMRGSQP
ncbi:transposase [Streptomyces flaveus]|nr:transposase [Streptomyces flaveus]